MTTTLERTDEGIDLRRRYRVVRKRLERSGLRWQARLEGLRFDRLAPWGIAVVYWIVLALLALARSRELSQDVQLAVPMQAVWLIGEGFTPEVSLLGHNLLWEQGAFLLYPVAGLTAVLPTATTLLVLQAGALALSVVPLWRLARRVAGLRVGATSAVVFAYCLYAAVHALNLAGFHPEVFAVPALIAAVLHGYQHQQVRYWLTLAVVLLARADLGLVVAGLGLLWLVERRRRLAWTTALVGVSYFLVMLLIVQPGFNDGTYPHLDAFTVFGTDNPFDVFWGMLSSPVAFAEDLFSDENFRVVVTLLAPVLFLPVVAPRYLLPAMPVFVLYLVADVPQGQLVEAQQNVPMTAFVFVATVFALARTGRILVERVNVDRRVIAALVFTGAVFFIRDAPASPYEEPWSWGRRDDADLVLVDAAERIPDDAVVRASPRITPLLTERPGLFVLDTEGPFTDETADLAAQRVNYIVFDKSAAPAWDPLEFEQFELRLVNRFMWRKIFENDAAGVVIYRLPNATVIAPGEADPGAP